MCPAWWTHHSEDNRNGSCFQGASSTEGRVNKKTTESNTTRYDTSERKAPGTDREGGDYAEVKRPRSSQMWGVGSL